LSRDVYGHIVCLDIFEEASVVPLVSALKSLQHEMKASVVSLPTQEDLTVWPETGSNDKFIDMFQDENMLVKTRDDSRVPSILEHISNEGLASSPLMMTSLGSRNDQSDLRDRFEGEQIGNILTRSYLKPILSERNDDRSRNRKFESLQTDIDSNREKLPSEIFAAHESVPASGIQSTNAPQTQETLR
jgi:hypothetical protein